MQIPPLTEITWEEFDQKRISDNTRVPLQFGKYRGRSLADIAEEDPDYLEWLRDNVDLRPWQTEAIDFLLS